MKKPFASNHLALSPLISGVGNADPVHVADLMNRLPVSAFIKSDSSLSGLRALISETRGDSQASVLKVALARGPGLFQDGDPSLHLFLAGKVGAQGNAQGVQALSAVWEVAGLPAGHRHALWRVGSGKALLHQNEEALQACWENNPSDKARPDALRLAWHRAGSLPAFEWGWQWSIAVPWEERLECLFLALLRAWPLRPVLYPVASPRVVLDFSMRVLESLPWDNDRVPVGVKHLFDAPQSPFAVLWEHEFLWDPRLRQEALLGCLGLSRELEGRGVTLRWASHRWEAACLRHGSRLEEHGLA